MLTYHLSFKNPATQLIEVEIQTVAEVLHPKFHLPMWRPGRYELQRFDKLVADVESGNHLKINRLDTHTWQVLAEKGESISLKYVFYANQRDSGGSVFDAEGIYLNYHNFLMYAENQLDTPCKCVLNLPEHYQIACSLKKEGNTFSADTFHELIDSPLFAGDKLQYHGFQIDSLKVHLWFMGECQPDFQRFEQDITKYTKTQVALFGDCPVEEYHYLLQMLPTPFRHGVEHQASSVNTFGPGHLLMQPANYDSFIELLSHEFFHTWNVKYLRPADMYPYDYSEPQYSTLHHVTEGVTSYYGDLMLLKSGIYTTNRFLQNLNSEIYEFFNMLGKDHISLEESSFTSWINGYGAFTGMPNRKISFYTKGYLVAFMLDVEIRKNSNNQASMDSVLKHLYQTIAKKGQGYTKQDYQEAIELFAGVNFDDFFAKYIEGIVPLHNALKETANYFGWNYMETSQGATSQRLWGLYLNGSTVQDLHEKGATLAAGLSKGDEIIAIQGQKVTPQSIEGIFEYFQNKSELSLHYFHFNHLYEAKLTRNENEVCIEVIPFLQNTNLFETEKEKAWKSIQTEAYSTSTI
ncbi:MAG: M61 family metallopeptidase [Bacteroidia bacterium]